MLENNRDENSYLFISFFDQALSSATYMLVPLCHDDQWPN